ncbi:hypothetical protein LD39_13955, partial [Halobacillus sp. BBL2006]
FISEFKNRTLEPPAAAGGFFAFEEKRKNTFGTFPDRIIECQCVLWKKTKRVNLICLSEQNLSKRIHDTLLKRLRNESALFWSFNSPQAHT